MIEALRSWFNGKRDYSTGTKLYIIYGDNLLLKNSFVKGETNFTRRRLEEELTKIFENAVKLLQTGQLENCEGSGKIMEAISPVSELSASPIKDKPSELVRQPLNPDLEKICDAEAKLQYKQMMNTRAELFAHIRNVAEYEALNSPDRIGQRLPLALSIIKQNYGVGEAYDKLAHVRQHGQLPNQEAIQVEDISTVPDAEVKATIDNIRKNLSKMRKREATAERVVLMQKHTENLVTLLKRWDSLKSDRKPGRKQQTAAG